MAQQTGQTYLLIGHVTKDLQADNRYTIGGTVTYAAVIARNMAWNPVIITTAAPEFSPPAFLANVDWRILPAPHTTTFHNQYDALGNRTQIIGPISGTIQPTDIPPDCRNAALVHFCPLAQELQPEITTAFEQSLLVATPQGWMRYWNKQGLVSLGDWQGAAKVLPKLQAVVISLEDVRGDWAIAEAWAAQTNILVVTQGSKGCTVFHQHNRQAIPPRPSAPVDPTGAGDVFAAAFFIRLQETGDLWHAARFANVMASMAIERPGPANAPHRAEVEAYLAQNPLEPAP